jgi:hypothetical protein
MNYSYNKSNLKGIHWNRSERKTVLVLHQQNTFEETEFEPDENESKNLIDCFGEEFFEKKNRLISVGYVLIHSYTEYSYFRYILLTPTIIEKLKTGRKKLLLVSDPIEKAKLLLETISDVFLLLYSYETFSVTIIFLLKNLLGIGKIRTTALLESTNINKVNHEVTSTKYKNKKYVIALVCLLSICAILNYLNLDKESVIVNPPLPPEEEDEKKKELEDRGYSVLGIVLVLVLAIPIAFELVLAVVMFSVIGGFLFVIYCGKEIIRIIFVSISETASATLAAAKRGSIKDILNLLAPSHGCDDLSPLPNS